MGEMIKKMIRSKFDEDIEIPNISLENINKRLEEMDKITNEMLNPFDSAFDKMVKDIRDRQDNVIAMEFTKCIGELLRKNGVVPKITEYTRNFETDNTFETRYGVSIDELDFSEHDKVFEDKIAELDRMRKVWLDKAVEWQKENDLLKQRIAELESKETENCGKEPKISDSAPSREWYENRHQSDCIEINRLNTTIDVLIHKVEYLRQFAGLE